MPHATTHLTPAAPLPRATRDRTLLFR